MVLRSRRARSFAIGRLSSPSPSSGRVGVGSFHSRTVPVVPARPRFARPPSPKTGRDDTSLPVPLLLAQSLHRHYAFPLGRIEHDHAPGLAPLGADLGDAAADQLA